MVFNGKGIFVLDMAIKSNNGKTIDKCVRKILRVMANPEPRGKRIIFNDFYLGKSYWRWYWAKYMSEKEEINLKFEEILSILDEEYYGIFSEKMHSKKSYISQTNVFGGLLLYLYKNTSTSVKSIGKIIDKLSYLSACKAIEIQSPELNRKEIESLNIDQ